MDTDKEPSADEHEFNRRRGDRRSSELSEETPDNRRGPDRRRNKPGFMGLINALFSNKT